MAAVLVGVIVAMRRFAGSPWAYLLPALMLWLAVLSSGVHATIAGVVLGLLTPAHPVRGRPVLEQLEHRLHPVSGFLVVPLFALANAGIDLRGGALGEALHARLTWAVVAGLVVGKTAGIWAAAALMRRRGWGQLPAQMPPRQLPAVAALGGIGFTVALFVTDLAFTDAVLINQAKVGILVGSAVATLLGACLLLAAPPPPRPPPPRPPPPPS